MDSNYIATLNCLIDDCLTVSLTVRRIQFFLSDCSHQYYQVVALQQAPIQPSLLSYTFLLVSYKYFNAVFLSHTVGLLKSTPTDKNNWL